MKKLAFLPLLLFAVYGGHTMAETLPAPQTRGVWISENYLTGGPSAIETMIRNLSAANVNVIYVEVYTHGETIYPSTVMENAGGVLQNPTFAGTDPLKTIIDIAHRYGIQVFAWFASPFLLSVASSPNQIPPILVKHPDWTAIPRDTTEHYFPSSSGSGYTFEIDPTVTGAANFVVNLETEVARNYPDIDGIETDIENDTTGWYGDTARALFMKETGNPDPLTLPDYDAAWFAWRQQEVTNVVKSIYQSVKSVNPECVVSAAVPPPYMSGYSLESWSVWADSGYVDVMEPMLYLSPSSFSTELSISDTYVPNGFQIFPGVDIGTAGSFTKALTEMTDATSGGAEGVVIWYYGYLLSYPGAFTSLKSQLFPEKTLPSFDDLIIDNYGGGVFRTTGSWDTQRGGLGGYGGTYMAAPATSGDTAIFSQRIYRSGNYDLYGYWPGDSSSNCARAVVQVAASNLNRVDTVDQKLDLNSWDYIDRVYLNSGDVVSIRLFGTGGGNLVANAFRLRRANQFVLSDYAVPDSETILLKFSNPLLDPLSPATSVSASSGGSTLKSFVDPVDNTILHVTIPAVRQDVPFTVDVSSLVDNSYDTLSFSQAMDYDPDSTTLIVDDQTQNSFLRMSGVWIQDTSSSAIDGEFWLAKQSSPLAEAEWGPLPIEKDGYYDVYVHIPSAGVAVSSRCLYIVKNDIATDSVYVSQQSGVGSWMDIGNFPFNVGGQYSVSISSLPGADASQYVVADAVMLKRSVEVTGIKSTAGIAPEKFNLGNNYPNPFNPSTIIDVSLARSGFMSLRIYNVLGQLVKVVDEGYKQAGEYRYTIDMDRFASGVYFYTLRQGTNVMTKKMLFLK